MRPLPKKRAELPDVNFTAQVWKEGASDVSYAPELDVSSWGDFVAQAQPQARLRESVSLFLGECSRKGTLDTILSESGFAKRGQSYRLRRILVRLGITQPR